MERRLEAPDVEAVDAGDLAAVCVPARRGGRAGRRPGRPRRPGRGRVGRPPAARSAGLYRAVYGFEHPRPDLLDEAVYGLRSATATGSPGARVVANPGCYPEAAILALLPLAGPVEDVVIDAKSGVSGAGRTPTETVHYSRAADNVSPYKVYAHRHTPEIEQELGQPGDLHAASRAGGPRPAGHLLRAPARRRARTPDDLRDLYAAYYADHPFVEVVEAPPGMRAVQHTNYAQVCPVADPRGGRITAFGAIDNLGKGAAGQAAPEPQPHGGPARDRGPALMGPLPAVGRDDWLRAPEGLELVAGGSVTTPPGFRAAGVACGLKASGAARPRHPGRRGPRRLGDGRHDQRPPVGARPPQPRPRPRGHPRRRRQRRVGERRDRLSRDRRRRHDGPEDRGVVGAAPRAGRRVQHRHDRRPHRHGAHRSRESTRPSRPFRPRAAADFGRAICTTDRAPKGGAFRPVAVGWGGGHRRRRQGRRDDLAGDGHDARLRHHRRPRRPGRPPGDDRRRRGRPRSTGSASTAR